MLTKKLLDEALAVDPGCERAARVLRNIEQRSEVADVQGAVNKLLSRE